MTGRHASALMMAVALALLAAHLAAQPACYAPGGYAYAPPAPGYATSWGNLTPAAQQRIADLSRNIDRAQWELWNLREHGACWREVTAKRNEVLQYRFDLARYLTDLPSWSGVVGAGALTPVSAPPWCTCASRAATTTPCGDPAPCSRATAPTYRPPAIYRPPCTAPARPAAGSGQQQQQPGQQQQQGPTGQQQQQRGQQQQQGPSGQQQQQ